MKHVRAIAVRSAAGARAAGHAWQARRGPNARGAKRPDRTAVRIRCDHLRAWLQ